MKRVALINDLSGIGRCSLTVALPIVSASGHECAVLPTAILSNHTGFDSYTFFDFTDSMQEYISCWEKLGIGFDTVYSGFLGSDRQIDITLGFMSDTAPYALKLVDPVMGDGGRIYSTCTEGMQRHMRRLAAAADVVTPNLTELCVLCGNPYPKSRITLDDIGDMCVTLIKDGAKSAVVTGLDSSVVSGIDDGEIVNYVYTDKHASVLSGKKVARSYCGTGDVFASVLCGALTSGMSLETAVKRAEDFTYVCTRDTYEKNGGHLYGVRFEDKLHLLSSPNERIL